MRQRGTSGVASEPLAILVRIEADDMNLDRAIGVAQSSLQHSAELAQQREHGCLVGLIAGNPVRRYARNQDGRQACGSCVPHRKTWLLCRKSAGDTTGAAASSQRCRPGVIHGVLSLRRREYEAAWNAADPNAFYCMIARFSRRTRFNARPDEEDQWNECSSL